MTFFEQSVYAIEEFVAMRKKLNLFRQDKYFLALTSSSSEANFQNATQSAMEEQTSPKKSGV